VNGPSKADRESLALGRHPKVLKIIAEARARLAAGRGLSHEEVVRALLPKRTRRKRSKSRRVRSAR
jgi:hypothetical protein